jgi:extradiol dioxygenase family protein
VLRTDKVTQTIELNEDTSLRKGRDAITMSDIQVGDHLFARGGLENDVFVSKVVVVIDAEQWKRMQERLQEMDGKHTVQPGQRTPASAATDGRSQTPKPPEPQH